MRYISTTGIILKKRNIGEQDQYVTLFSPTLGKIDARAKGSRKITSSFMGHLETLNVCVFQLYKNGSHFTITQCQVQESFKKIREQLKQTFLSLHLIEIFLTMAQSEENGEELFELLTGTLKKLDRENKNSLYLENFKIKILTIAGALPNVSRCGNCDIRWQPGSMIQMDQEGHIFCQSCAPERSMLIPFNTMKLIHFLKDAPFHQVQKIKSTPKEESSLKTLTDIFLQNYIITELRTEKIMTLLNE